MRTQDWLPTTVDPEFNDPIQVGEIYGDERHSEINEGEEVYPRKYEVVFVDENRVFLRNLDGADDYRHERVDQFSEGRGNRWKLIDKGQVGMVSSIPETAPLIQVLKNKVNDYQEDTSRKTAHKAAALQEAIDIIKELRPDDIDWTEIDGVGEETAENIVEAGYKTAIDIRIATDDELQSVPGVGEKVIELMKAHIEKE
jgi:DNA uptake protein ComE-like DNA-binding protein